MIPRSAPSVLLLLLVPLLLGAAEGPLTNEEIVRRVAAGESTGRILGAIASREPGYDLDPEILEEMVRAGVPRSVIAAMKARTAEAPSAPEAPPAPQEPEAPPALTIEFDARARLEFPERLPDDLRRHHELAPLDDAVTDLAVFVICRTPDHVADRWRSATPLGRDFTDAPRHRMHLWRPGATRKGGRLVLLLPQVLEVPLETGTRHDLGIGWAVQVGERWLTVHWTPLDGVTVGGWGERARGTVERTEGKLPALRAALVEPGS